MIIITGIFLFLLGTKLGQAATKTQVKYEGPNQITVNEEKDEQIVVPGFGSPPFAPSFFHQGSNFFFNPQFMLPGETMPLGIERAIAPFQPSNEVIVTPEVNADIIVEPPTFPMLEIEDSIQTIPQVQIEIDRLPIRMPGPNPPIKVLAEEPCADVEITNIPGFPMMIEEPFQQLSGGLFTSEVDVRINEIPPPPELSPLIISEIPKPVFVQEKKKVILIPSVPELTSFYPPSMMVAENPLIPTDCAQNIIMERFLPNIAFENGKAVELISIPATKRAPVLSSLIY